MKCLKTRTAKSIIIYKQQDSYTPFCYKQLLEYVKFLIHWFGEKNPQNLFNLPETRKNSYTINMAQEIWWKWN